MSDLDKELERIAKTLWAKYGKPGTMDDFLADFNEPIKQAISTHVIGEDTGRRGCTCAHEHINQLKSDQRQSLWSKD